MGGNAQMRLILDGSKEYYFPASGLICGKKNTGSLPMFWELKETIRLWTGC